MGPESVQFIEYLCVGGAGLVGIGLPIFAIYLMNKSDKDKKHTEHQAFVDQAKRARAASQSLPRGKDLTGQSGKPGSRLR